MEVYLNSVEWGPGLFGAQAAARRYFTIDAAKLDRRQAALLAVALPSPHKRNPRTPGVLHRQLAERLLGKLQRGQTDISCLKSLHERG